tara:strand:+ start:118 stop:681 length:564 start_codon:yes stop_codon:yes gene_type:complete
MRSKTLWKDVVYEDNIRGINLLDIENFAHKWREKSPGKVVSNRGGWQSENYINMATRFAELEANYVQKCDELDKLIACINKKFRWHRVSIDELWFNINQVNSYNVIHDHLGAKYSGVIYLNSTEQMGNIVFVKNTNLNHMSSHEIDMYTSEYPSVTGKMYIFSGSVPHYVKINSTLNDRISLSFNLN